MRFCVFVVFMASLWCLTSATATQIHSRNPSLARARRSHELGYARRKAAFPGSPTRVPPEIRPVPVGNSSGGYVLSVVDFGADPTGQKDSSDAILKTILAAYAIGKANGFNFSWGVDAGGVVIDLVGGQYRLDSPVVWPGEAGGNLVVQHGSLHASASFPAGRYLFELDMVPPPSVASQSAQEAAQACLSGGDPRVCSSAGEHLRGTATGYDDITFRSILFDAGLRGGGVKLLNALRIYFDGCYWLGYAAGSAGLWTTKAGGAVYVAQSWFSGYDWPDSMCESAPQALGVAMLVEFPDSMADEVIIACSQAGMVDNSGAFIAQSVHVFGVSNSWGNGYFSLVKGWAASRLIAPYVDWSRINVAAGASLSIEQGFFLGCPQADNETSHPWIVLNASAAPNPHDVTVKGFSVRSSQFKGLPCGTGDKQPRAIEMRGLLPNAKVGAMDSVVDDNSFEDAAPATSRPRLSLFGLQQTTFSVELNASLAFPVNSGLAFSAFESIVYSAKQYAGDAFTLSRAGHAQSPTSIAVEFEQPINGSVSIIADQSKYSASTQ